MDFSELLHGLKLGTWTYLICYMDLSKMLNGFVKVVTWVCQSCSMYLSPFAKQNQAEVSPRLKLVEASALNYRC